MFDVLVDPIRAAVFAAAQLLGGSLGAGILAVSSLLRLALLPLTLRLARRAGAQQRLLASLKPQLALIQKRHAKAPELLIRDTRALYQRAGYNPVDPQALLGGLARLPLFAGLYGALRQVGAARRFAWIADLARPDVALVILTAAATGVATWLGAQTGGAAPRSAIVFTMIAVGLSVAFFWHASSALVLSWGASAAVDVVQGAILLRERRRAK